LHEAGIKVWEQVGSVTTAKEAVDSGTDLIIAEGSEAGGHNYGSLYPLLGMAHSFLDRSARLCRLHCSLMPDCMTTGRFLG
jgi:NAD(P)H-dependent flavin oxidoreductase YrpB (nitropropane dioxygenase family)